MRSWPSGSSRSASCAPYADLNDVVRRAGLTVAQTEALATAGAFDGFGLSRRQALWNAGYADNDTTLPGSAIDAAPPVLPGMSEVELTLADIWATTISPDDHPMQHLRPVLDANDIVPIAQLGEAYAERRVRVAGTDHPPAAAGDRGRDHLPQPGGRDRDAERGLFPGAVAPVRPGRPQCLGHDHPRQGSSTATA